MSAITIPEGFFPLPGVPFSTEAQVHMACALSMAKIVQVEFLTDGWRICDMQGGFAPSLYRLAPPKPRTVGPFESDEEHNVNSLSAWQDVVSAAGKAGFKRFRIKLTATAEEILP